MYIHSPSTIYSVCFSQHRQTEEIQQEFGRTCRRAGLFFLLKVKRKQKVNQGKDRFSQIPKYVWKEKQERITLSLNSPLLTSTGMKIEEHEHTHPQDFKIYWYCTLHFITLCKEWQIIFFIRLYLCKPPQVWRVLLFLHVTAAINSRSLAGIFFFPLF